MAGGSYVLTERDLDALSRIAAAEALNQSRQGRSGVIATVMNRVASDRFPNTIADVLNQPGQFEPVTRAGGSWENLTRAPQTVWDEVRSNMAAFDDPTGGATFFANPEVTDRRGTTFNRDPLTVIQDHAFFDRYSAGDPVSVPAYSVALEDGYRSPMPPPRPASLSEPKAMAQRSGFDIAGPVRNGVSETRLNADRFVSEPIMTLAGANPRAQMATGSAWPSDAGKYQANIRGEMLPPNPGQGFVNEAWEIGTPNRPDAGFHLAGWGGPTPDMTIGARPAATDTGPARLTMSGTPAPSVNGYAFDFEPTSSRTFGSPERNPLLADIPTPPDDWEGWGYFEPGEMFASTAPSLRGAAPVVAAAAPAFGAPPLPASRPAMPAAGPRTFVDVIADVFGGGRPAPRAAYASASNVPAGGYTATGPNAPQRTSERNPTNDYHANNSYGGQDATSFNNMDSQYY